MTHRLLAPHGLCRKLLSEGHQEHFCVIVPALDPTLVNVAAGGRRARRDHKDWEPKPPRRLGRLHFEETVGLGARL